MTPFLSLILMTLPAQASHEQLNPVYAELLKTGVKPTATSKSLPLPAPTMADGLDANGQAAAIKALLKARRDDIYDDGKTFLRDDAHASYVFHSPDINCGDRSVSAYGVDLWFVAFGDLATAWEKDLHTALSVPKAQFQRRQDLKPDDLARLGIQATPANDNRKESYHHAVTDLFENVRLSATSRRVQSRTADSIVIATTLDPRFTDPQFAGSKEFPNQWQRLEEKKGQAAPVGPKKPYGGVAAYMKITRLSEPKGALFIEYHQVANEPQGWSGDNELIRPKLRKEVLHPGTRVFRRELGPKD